MVETRLVRPSGRSATRIAVVAAYLALLAVAVTWPLVPSLGGGSLAAEPEADLLLNQYLVLWGAHALSDGEAQLPHTNMFHPERWTYGYSDMLLSSSLLALPAVAVGATPDQVYGLLLLSSLAIGGLGMRFFARRMGLGEVGALFAATIYVANPAHLARYRHIQLFTDHWLPWLLWALLGWLAAVGLAAERRDEGGSAAASPSEVAWRSALVAGLFVLQALTGSHNAVFGALLGGAVVGAHLLGGLSRLRRPPTAVRFAAGAALILVLASVVLAPIFATYLEVYEALRQGRLGAAEQEAEVVAGYSAGLRELLTGPSDLWTRVEIVTGWPGRWIGSGRRLRAHLFPGAIPWLLAAVGLLALRPRRRPPAAAVGAWLGDGSILAALALAAASVAAGAATLGLPTALLAMALALAGLALRLLSGRTAPHLLAAAAAATRRRWQAHPTLLLLGGLLALLLALALGPEGRVYELLRVLPGVELIRAPSRFWLPGLIVLAVLAGCGAEALQRRFGPRLARGAGTYAPSMALAMVAALFLLEAEMVPLRTYPVPYPPDEVGRWLADQPDDAALIEIPINTAPPAAVRQMIRSVGDWRPLVIGYSGSTPPGYRERMQRLAASFPERTALAELRQLGVGWIVVDHALLAPEDGARIAATSGLELAATFDTREIYRLLPAR